MPADTEPSPTLTVFRGWVDQGCYVWSPFVTKLELRLRLSNTPYRAAGGSPFSGPTKKIPYIEISGNDGEASSFVGDSSLIINHLLERGLIQELNNKTDPASNVQDLAIRALLEDKLYFLSMRERWLDNYYVQRDHVLCTRPLPVRVVVGLLIYRQIRQTMYGQGTGRHTAEAVREFRDEIWHSLNDLLKLRLQESVSVRRGKVPFWCLGGETPTECDTVLFGFIVSVLVSTSGPDSRKLVKSLPAVLEYADRIHDRFFPDYDKWD